MAVSNAEVQTFTRGFSGLIDSCESIVRSLTDLAARQSNPDLGQTIEQVNQEIQAGSTLSEAFGRYPTVFSEGYVGNVRQGGIGGTLQSALQSLCRS